MKKRELGNTRIKISEVAFGGVEIGMPYGIGVNSEHDMLSEEKAIELLRTAMDSGINFFDTARMYGSSERIMGKAFRGRREGIVIASKCIHLLDSEGKLPPKNKIKGIIEKSLTESLEALQTEYIDIYMLHQTTIEILENDEILKVFSDLKSQGLFKATGVSSYTNEVSKKTIDASFWNMIQLPFNLMDQRQGELFDEAQQKGVGIVVRSVLLKGLLSDRGNNLHPALKDVEKHIVKYRKLLDDTNYTLPAMATKFALSFPQVSSVLVGIDKQAYLDEALNTVNGDYLSSEKLAQAKKMAYPEPEFLNLQYWDKMNWLK